MDNINRIDDEIKKTKGLIEVLDEELKEISSNDAKAYICKSINDCKEKIFYLEILKELFEAQDKEISYLKENIKLIKENITIKEQHNDIYDNYVDISTLISDEELTILANMLAEVINSNLYKELKEECNGDINLDYIVKYEDCYGTINIKFAFKTKLGEKSTWTETCKAKFTNLVNHVNYYNIDKVIEIATSIVYYEQIRKDSPKVHELADKVHELAEEIYYIKSGIKRTSKDGEIKVGDGVALVDDPFRLEGIVTKVHSDGQCELFDRSGSVIVADKSKLEKTGNHYDQVANLITAK